jgi:multiple sugar transport system substrate-binding protein
LFSTAQVLRIRLRMLVPFIEEPRLRSVNKGDRKMAMQVSRRAFLKSAGLVAAASGLAACAPGTAPPAPAQEPAKPSTEGQPTSPPAAEGVALQYWVGWSGAYAKLWDTMVQTDEFKQMVGPNTLSVKPSMGGEPMTTAVAAGTPPDLGGNGFFYLDYMARGVLQPVDDLVAASSVVKKADFLEGSWESGFYKGKQYGVPANEGFVRYALCFNNTLVQGAGLDPKAPPQTWSETLEWHKTLTKFDDAGNLKQVGLDPYDAIGGSMNPIDGFFAGDSWGAPPYFDENTGKFDLDNEYVADIFDTFAEFYKVIGPDKMSGFRAVQGQGTWGDAYLAGVQALIINGYWVGGEIQSKPEVADATFYTWAPVSDARKGVKIQYPGGHVICIFKDSKHHAEAFKVAEFLQTKVACDTIWNGTGFLPARTEYLKTVDRSRFPNIEFFFNSVTEATEWAKLIRCVIANYVETQHFNLGEAVYRGQMTGKEAAAEMQRSCTDEWQKSGLA